MKTSILIVDDEHSGQVMCAEILNEMGFETESAGSATRALEILECGHMDIVLTDAKMPGIDGIELLGIIKEKYPETEVVIMSGFGTISTAVEAMKRGAHDYITRPFTIEDFRQLFQRLVEKQDLLMENRFFLDQIKARHGLGNLGGTSSGMRQTYRLILKAAQKRNPVLILGETGTGKELVARAVHALGPWKDKPFVTVDCGALASTLIDTELFGHVRGAFTGADQARQGLFVSACDGTIFLDEIAELPIELQGKLLHVLQEHEVRPIGGNQWTHVEARVIAATNQDILAAIERGTFRQDLYFRLNLLCINVPPLRQRKSDIPGLAYDFIDQHRDGTRVTAISAGAMNRLIKYDWPGNVRELENCIQRAILLVVGPVILENDLPPSVLYDMGVGRAGTQVPLLYEIERRTIIEALETVGGDRVRAAKILGIGKTTIYRKVREMGLAE